jgi:hypothetical protein
MLGKKNKRITGASFHYKTLVENCQERTASSNSYYFRAIYRSDIGTTNINTNKTLTDPKIHQRFHVNQ